VLVHTITEYRKHYIFTYTDEANLTTVFGFSAPIEEVDAEMDALIYAMAASMEIIEE